MNDQQLIEKYLPKKKQKKAIKKLNKGYPVQYVIGNVEFCDVTLLVNKNVLIPRFETEFLVEKALKLIKSSHKVLDIGTGSGAIAIALKKHSNAMIDATDISKKALRVARKNARLNKVDINFFYDDITNSNITEKYDVIISNPPYVDYKENVDPKTKYEPQNAIFAREEGLSFYRVILEKAKSILNKKGIIAFEIGNKQANKIKKIAKDIFKEAKCYIEKDLAGKDRYFFLINE